MILGPSQGELDDEALLAAYPWPESGRWVRAMMVTSLDGAAVGPDGLSGSISSGSDQEVFSTVRRLADAVLVGAGTIRAEGYGPMQASEADVARRTEAGQAPAPVLAIVSGSLDLDFAGPMFARSTVRPIVITGSEADPEKLEEARGHADVVQTASSTPQPDELLTALEGRGLRRIVCEGGPTLLGSLVEAGLVDEADITLSPMFAANAASPRTSVPSAPVELTLHQVIEAEGTVMLRYLAPGRR